MISRSGLAHRLQRRDGHAFPEFIRLDPLDDLGLLAHRVQVHLQRRQPIQQFDLQIGELARLSQYGDLHARHQQVERVGVAHGRGCCATA